MSLNDCNIPYPHIHCSECENPIALKAELPELNLEDLPTQCPHCGHEMTVELNGIGDVLGLLKVLLGIEGKAVLGVLRRRGGPPSDPRLN